FKLPDCVINQYAEDKLFKVIISEPGKYGNLHTIDGVLYLMQDSNCLLLNGRKVREVIITHTHWILVHLGACKTLTWLRTQVWW
ncbi:hypothetical protein BDV93DRAFT_403723, partial [Ceratobasidium sp. AG-I]